MHSKLSERWKLSFRVDFKSIWFDLIRFDLMMRLAGKSWSWSWSCTLRRQLNQIKQTRLQAGGLPDSMSYHCLGEVASGATGCLARLSPDLTSLAFLLIRYVLGISEVCQPMEQRALYITLCCCWVRVSMRLKPEVVQPITRGVWHENCH